MPSNSRGTRTRTRTTPASGRSKPQATSSTSSTPKAQGKGTLGAGAGPVVRATSTALTKRQARAALRAAERRRRTNIVSGVVAALVVIALVFLLKDHLPTPTTSGKSGAQATATSCPATPTPIVGPSTAVTPAPKPPALPADAKTVNGDQGLQYVDITTGCGSAVKSGDNVIVNYTGWLQSTGAMFDSSLKAGGQPFEVDNVGSAQVISGWNLGLIGMKPGGTRRLIVPSALGYGTAGAPQGGIPANATLVFDITLLSIK
jgi:hypothetical protein